MPVHDQAAPRRASQREAKMTRDSVAIKVPAATAAFWLAKILATTVGEVGGNLASMDMGLGYLQATGLLGGLFAALAVVQVRARRFHPVLYWATIVASTTAGTTLADYATRSIGMGYAGGSLLLLALVLASLFTWRAALGRVAADDVQGRRAETFYWITITFSQTLGTALGDWFADSAGLGYSGSALIFGAMLLVILYLHFRRAVSGVVLFWAAFVLTRPFGAVVGNFFDKPVSHGGLEVSRPLMTAVLIGMMVAALLLFPTRPGAASAAGANDNGFDR
mgnify:CR=1 FL=1